MIIEITKSGKIFRKLHEDSKKKTTIKSISLIPYLGDNIIISKGTTFETFMDLLTPDRKLINMIFFSDIKGLDIMEFIKEMKSELKNADEDDKMKIDYLVIKRNFSYNEYKDETLGLERYFDYYALLEGYGDWSNKTKGAIAVDFTPLNKLKNLHLVIDNEINITAFGVRKFKNIINKKNGSLIMGKCEITLYEVIKAILYEITWHGNISQRNERRKDLEERRRYSDKRNTL